MYVRKFYEKKVIKGGWEKNNIIFTKREKNQKKNIKEELDMYISDTMIDGLKEHNDKSLFRRLLVGPICATICLRQII